MKIDKILSEDKTKIKRSLDLLYHARMKEKWTEIKKVLDVLYKEIPLRIPKGELWLSVDLYSIGLKSYTSDWLLEFLWTEEKICGFPKNSTHTYEGASITIKTDDPMKDYLRGSVTVYDVKGFVQFRNKILDMCNFIQTDGEKRFPEQYLPLSPNNISSKGTTKKKTIRLPLSIGENEDIFITGTQKIFLPKQPNRKYRLIRGAIEKVNDDGTVNVDVLFEYMQKFDSEYQERNHLSDENLNLKQQWKKMLKAFNNMRQEERNDIKNIEKYLVPDKRTKMHLKWKI